MSIFKRIKMAREKAGISQGELSRRLGITRACVSNWESQDSSSTGMSGENLLKCASILNVSAHWLQFGNENSITDENVIRKVPILEINDINNWLKLPIINEIGENMVYKGKLSQKGFVFRITGDSMVNYKNPSQSIFDGDEAVVEPALKDKIKHKDLVLVNFGDNDIKVRMYVEDGKDKLFKAFDDSYKTLSLDSENHKIIGVIISVYRVFKKL